MEFAIEYAKKLVGTPYEWWTPDKNMLDGINPFWAANRPAPSPEEVKSLSCTCVGLINLMRRSIVLCVPGVSEGNPYAGGTYVWFAYLSEKTLLHKFDADAIYPKGTLLLRNYSDEFDQGHVAVVVSEEKNPDIIHCYSDFPLSPEHLAHYELTKQPIMSTPGVHIEKMSLSHEWDPNGFYTHVCLPTDWLCID
jgi:hypothetical protein